MADEFSKNNLQNAISLFYTRQIYQLTALQAIPNWYEESGDTNLISFRSSEKLFYGRVDYYYVPIILNPQSLPLDSFNQAEGMKAALSAPAFVVDAFNDLSRQFQKAAANRKIVTNDRFLTTPTPVRAYESPQKQYYDYSNKLAGQLTTFYVENNITFKDFKEFLIHFKESVRRLAPEFPITLPAYVKSKYCSVMNSGLAIDIADLVSTDDQKKIDDFITSKNWRYYVNACRSYGFFVDADNPWRLIADIGSSEMVKYATRYGFNSTYDILATGYQKAHSVFFERFKNFMLRLYNKLKTETYIVPEYCQNGKVVTHIRNAQDYTLEDISKLFSDDFFLDLYCEIRIAEEESKYSQSKKNKLISQTIRLSRLKGTRAALRQFENIINTTYDYSGALTEKVARAILMEEDRTGNLE